MSDDPRHELVEALLIELIRQRVVNPDVVERVRQRFDDEAANLSGSSRAARYEALSVMAAELLLSAAAPDPEDWRREQRHRRDAERLARLSRRYSERDGGNERS